MSVQQLSPIEWLAGADRDPEHAFNWWTRHPDEIAMIPTGGLFDAVKTSILLGQHVLAHLAAAGQPERPVFISSDNGTMYFLVPPGTAATWPAASDTDCLGEDAWLWVPVPTRIHHDGAYWVHTPDGSGDLHDPQALHVALTAARGTL